MQRPTVNDIAREAGVSLATVDRVLNARPGVREKTITAVNDAIQKLGYVRDQAAANLARGRDYRFAILMPDTQSQFVQTLVDALEDAASLAATSRTRVEFHRFPDEDMHALSKLMSQLAESDLAGLALMAPETPLTRDAIRNVKAKGIPVVAIASNMPNSDIDHYVGIDAQASGRTAGVLMGRFTSGQKGRVLVIANSMHLRESIERRRGFDEVIQRNFPQIEVLQTLETHGSSTTMRQVVAEMLTHTPDVTGIYVLGSGHRALASTLSEFGLLGRVIVIGHELTAHTRHALELGHMDAVITHNLGHLARSSLRVLRAKADRMPFDESQETLRIEIVIRENLPPAAM